MFETVISASVEMHEIVEKSDRLRRELTMALLPYKLSLEEKRKQTIQAKNTDFFSINLIIITDFKKLIYSSQLDTYINIEDRYFFVKLEFKLFLFLQSITNYYYMCTNHY